MTAKLDYLTDLGINALELQPVQEFNELEYYQVRPSSHTLLALLMLLVTANGCWRHQVVGQAHDMRCTAVKWRLCNKFPVHGACMLEHGGHVQL